MLLGRTSSFKSVYNSVCSHHMNVSSVLYLITFVFCFVCQCSSNRNPSPIKSCRKQQILFSFCLEANLIQYTFIKCSLSYRRNFPCISVKFISLTIPFLQLLDIFIFKSYSPIDIYYPYYTYISNKVVFKFYLSFAFFIFSFEN